MGYNKSRGVGIRAGSIPAARTKKRIVGSFVWRLTIELPGLEDFLVAFAPKVDSLEVPV